MQTSLDTIMKEYIKWSLIKYERLVLIMNKDDYIKIAQEKLKGNSKKMMINQINNYYNAK